MQDIALFLNARAGVLQQWSTGSGASDLEANAAFLAGRPLLSNAQLDVLHGTRPMIIQPRCGVGSPDVQLDLFVALQSEGASALSFQVDSLTRNNNYLGVDEAMGGRSLGRSSSIADTSMLNGYPMVNHGVTPLRHIAGDVQTPLQTRHSTRDPRLLAEISFAGGVSSFEGGAISYNIPYFRDYPLDQSIAAWQYVDRLTGLYHDLYGIVLDREFFGALTATLVPPSLALATNILEAALAAQQGVLSVSLGYAEQGNRTQDIAACRTLRIIAEDFLARLGFRDVSISIVFHQYMAGFPRNRQRATSLIRNSATTAALADATRVLTKTPAEAFHLPSLADNIDGVRLAREGIDTADATRLNESRIDEEAGIIRRETMALLEAVLCAGGGA